MFGHRLIGNTYMIENDYDDHVRIFFAQGCERLVEKSEDGHVQQEE